MLIQLNMFFYYRPEQLVLKRQVGGTRLGFHSILGSSERLVSFTQDGCGLRFGVGSS